MLREVKVACPEWRNPEAVLCGWGVLGLMGKRLDWLDGWGVRAGAVRRKSSVGDLIRNPAPASREARFQDDTIGWLIGRRMMLEPSLSN